MILIGGYEQAFICIGLAGQHVFGLAAVAVEEHRIAFACARGSGGKVGILNAAYTALVLQQLIAVRARADEVHALDGVDTAAVFGIADIGLNALGLGRGRGSALIGALVIIADDCRGAGIEQRVVIGAYRHAALYAAYMTAVHYAVIGARGDHAGAVDGSDERGLTVCGGAVSLHAAYLVIIGVDGGQRELTVVVERAITR